MDTLCKPNFMFLGRTVFETNAMITLNYHRTFLRYCATEELEIFLYINQYRYSMQTKFHVPRSQSLREKCDDNLKLASHISPILCDRGTGNFFVY